MMSIASDDRTFDELIALSGLRANCGTLDHAAWLIGEMAFSSKNWPPRDAVRRVLLIERAFARAPFAPCFVSSDLLRTLFARFGFVGTEWCCDRLVVDAADDTPLTIFPTGSKWIFRDKSGRGIVAALAASTGMSTSEICDKIETFIGAAFIAASESSVTELDRFEHGFEDEAAP